MKNTLLLISILSTIFSYAQQPTIGLLYNGGNATDGYTLFSPESGQTVYLIDNCGEKVKEWTFNEGPGLTCYLLENGNLLRSGKDTLQLKDWDDNLLWSYPTTANGINQHHDIQPLPNGNVLCVAADSYTKTEIVAQGRNPAITNANFKLDRIVELQPTGAETATIVWEWRFIDHIIQDFDVTKPNYGVVEDHPELFDINFDNGEGTDWSHVNSVHYSAELDQIIVSARHLSEIFIIDHSTTAVEVAGHTGGNSGKGGDLLWRWGNPQVYRAGTALDQKLFRQHDARFIPQGYADAGQISAFNNQDGNNTYSSVVLIQPTFTGGQYQMTGSQFLPSSTSFSWNGQIMGNTIYESKKSGVQFLSNGNIQFTESDAGRVTEITKSGEHLWTYRNPVGNTILSQFTEPTLTENSIFRADRYAPDYVGFNGHTLVPYGIIENTNDLSSQCSGTTSINESTSDDLVITTTNDLIQFSRELKGENLKIYNASGQLILAKDNFHGSNLSVNLNNGVYYIIRSSNEFVQSQPFYVIK